MRSILLPLKASLILLSTLLVQYVSGVQQCSLQRGGGICPDENTCCLKSDGSSGCIPKDMGKYLATCCPDGETGCPYGYACSSVGNSCYVVNQTQYTDSLVQELPRYRLCQAQGIETVLGIRIDEGAELAYYSSHGAIETIEKKLLDQIDMALIMIHGADRNGDDYFCAAKAAAELQNSYNHVLILAPQFYDEMDARPSKSLLYWDNDRNGAWRYGADALGPVPVSSYTALDVLVQKLLEILPSLTRLVIAGHSSGGQTVQRWSLLTSIWNKEITRAVVANPSSYAYMSPLRLLNETWTTPNDCPYYDDWEWGLSNGGDIEVPYRQHIAHNVSHLISRFQGRTITYLAGSQDRCNVSEPNGWCHSHGLETTCMDEVQGEDRLVRSARYMSSLRLAGFGSTHTRRIVPGVGHDHAMMFQSPTGIDTIFGGTDELEDRAIDTN